MRRLGKSKANKSSEASNDPDFYSISESPPVTNGISDDDLLARSSYHPFHQDNHRSENPSMLAAAQDNTLNQSKLDLLRQTLLRRGSLSDFTGNVTATPSVISTSNPGGDSELHSLQFQQQILQQRLQMDPQLSQSNSLLLPTTTTDVSGSGSSLREVLLRTQLENQLLRANLLSNTGIPNRSSTITHPLSQSLYTPDSFLTDYYG